MPKDWWNFNIAFPNTLICNRCSAIHHAHSLHAANYNSRTTLAEDHSKL